MMSWFWASAIILSMIIELYLQVSGIGIVHAVVEAHDKIVFPAPAI